MLNLNQTPRPGGGTPAGLMTACSLRNCKERVSFQPCGKDLVYKKKGTFLITGSRKGVLLETLIIEIRKKGCFPSSAKGVLQSFDLQK